MNKEKAETLFENYQALSELYSNTRKELERTRKALEIATSALYEICNDYQEDSSERAEKALKQITHDNSEKANSVEHKESFK